jgi:hypothetical protein
LVTGSGRFPYPVELSVPGNTQHFTSKDHVTSTIESLKHVIDDNDLVNLNNVIGWFEASTNERYFKDVAELMVDKISALSNTVLYPCFSDSFNTQQFKEHGLDKDIHYMHSMWFRQCELLDIDPNTFTAQEKEPLCGHLSIEFNMFFANMLFKRIQTGKWDHSGFFDVTIKHPRKFYYDNFKDE